MDPAFEFSAAPAARSRIRRIGRNRGAWLAADACVTAVVLRQVVKPMFARVFPNLCPGPLGQRAHLPQGFPAWQTVLLYFFEILSRRRLFAPQSREPHLERFQ